MMGIIIFGKMGSVAWDMTEAHNVSEAGVAPILMCITEFVTILIEPRQWTMFKIVFQC